MSTRQLRLRRLWISRAHRSRGQAAVEYLVVVSLTAVALIGVTLADPSTIDQIISAVKSFFQAFSYAMSIPAQDRF